MKSDCVRKGTEGAPKRALFHALGMTEEELNRPLVGIVNSYNEIVPGHMNLDKITEAVKIGVAMGGGTPVVFPAIAVCDGIAMGHQGMKYSLVTRDLIADSTEAMAIAHAFDALVMIPNCDKNVPGLLMAAARLNIPTIFVSGGPMLAGRVDGRKTSFSSISEAVGEFTAGRIDEAKLSEFEQKTCPTCGSCSGMYTANSMNCLTEVLGMGLRGNGTIPAVYSQRIQLAKEAGMQVMELFRRNIRPRDIMTEEAFRNALTMDMALGCSTNSMLHLPAIANECGIRLNVEIANEISEKTPNLCHLAPAGPTYMEDLNEAGGVYAVMNEINKLGLLHTELMTCTGKTVAENIQGCVNLNPEVIRPVENPYSKTGGIAVLKGNLAPDSCMVKRSAVAPEMLRHEGPARVFDCEEAVSYTHLDVYKRQTYANIHDELRKIYARTKEAKQHGFKAGDFSYNTGKLRCPVCDGTGSISLDVQFLPDVDIPCPECRGARYGKEAGLVHYQNKTGEQYTLPDLMAMDVHTARKVCRDMRLVHQRLRVLEDLGLGYLTLGEETPSLSGGEAQRLKLASEMGKSQTDSVFVFDEPTIGLHPLDVQTLLSVFQTLILNGATVIVIEHDLDVIRCADYIVDMGPGGGEEGGRIVAAGTPEEIKNAPQSVTGKYL